MQAWFFALARWQRVVLLVALVSVVLHAGLCAYRRTQKTGDFDVHRAFGQRFLDRDPLYVAGCFNYMPTSAMYYAPLALVDPSLGIALRYVVAVGTMLFTLVLLQRMVIYQHPKTRPKAFLISTLTVVLGLHYIVRDLDDGGPHLILLGMLVGGIYCAWVGRDVLAAAWFGLAIVLKMTPGLLLPFLIWKRRWRLAFLTTVATCAWMALPAVWLGPTTWWQQQQKWNRVALSVFSNRPDERRDINELRVQNQSLKLLAQRALTTYPEGDPMWLDHPGFISLLDLDSRTAGLMANAVLLTALAGCAWCWRNRYDSRQDPNWLLEMSGVMILMLLLSPVTWLQHMVFVIPALYLVVACDQALGGLPRWAKATMWIYVALSLGMNRELVGRENYLLLLSYQMHTICLLLVLAVLLRVRPTARPTVAAPNPSYHVAAMTRAAA